jgi:phosphatidylglycerophosphate synthase
VDGWLARRGGHVSDFGARFDMEVDGVLALVLALLAYAGGHAGALIVLLGVPLYLFRVAQIALPWLRGDLPPRFSRKLVCVVQIAVLIAVLVPPVSRPVADLLAAVAAAGLLWSFLVDIRWLWRARG